MLLPEKLTEWHKKVIKCSNQEHPTKKKIWNKIDETEFYAFIGLLLLRGDYKSANENLEEM